MATTMEMLEELQHRAHQDPALKEELLATRRGDDPLGAFCRKCREVGYEIDQMELV